MTINIAWPKAAALSLPLFLAACALAPSYQLPRINTAASFKEAGQGGAAQWTQALPADTQARGPWWQLFNDADLNALQAQAMAANPGLQLAASRLRQSRALLRGAKAEYMPELAAGLGVSRQRESPASTGGEAQSDSLWRAQLGLNYELDLFGRVASAVQAAKADAAQAQALLQSLQLALQADVAQHFFRLRELDAEQQLLTRTVVLRQQALALLERRFALGDISELDVARARTELGVAQSEQLALQGQRANVEHALAVLLGQAPADFTALINPLQALALNIPAGMPSALLERRPDIAAAERAMAAANARIGVARAAYFPRLSLSAAAGYASRELGDVLDWSGRHFLLGAALDTPLFDGGRRRAGLERARAAYEADVAQYRQTVLNAFREVEDHLASLRTLEQQLQVQGAALQSAQRAAELSAIRYREGSASYLDVIEADRSVLLQERQRVQLEGQRARFTVGLIRALGGGWERADSVAAR